MTKPSIVQPSHAKLARMVDLSHSGALSLPSLGEGFWRAAAAIYPSRNRRLVRLRLDPEVLDWFGARKDDAREGVNAVLRAYVEAQKNQKQKKNSKPKG